jgi:hypothetical protein
MNVPYPYPKIRFIEGRILQKRKTRFVVETLDSELISIKGSPQLEEGIYAIFEEGDNLILSLPQQEGIRIKNLYEGFVNSTLDFDGTSHDKIIRYNMLLMWDLLAGSDREKQLATWYATLFLSRKYEFNAIRSVQLDFSHYAHWSKRADLIELSDRLSRIVSLIRADKKRKQKEQNL